jgi:hypothetical protein
VDGVEGHGQTIEAAVDDAFGQTELGTSTSQLTK